MGKSNKGWKQQPECDEIKGADETGSIYSSCLTLAYVEEIHGNISKHPVLLKAINGKGNR